MSLFFNLKYNDNDGPPYRELKSLVAGFQHVCGKTLMCQI